MVTKNSATIEGAPSPETKEVEILTAEQVNHVVGALAGAMRAPAIVSLFTGLRLGEVLALRWRNVDMEDKPVIRVREALEETRQHGIRFKTPKTTAGLRDVSMPVIVQKAVTCHGRATLAQLRALGLGEPPDDALLFAAPLSGLPQSPRTFGKRWHRAASSIGIGRITFHALRHTHASQLIDAGIDV